MADWVGLTRTTLATTLAATATKSAGVSGYPHIRNGRGASAIRRRSTMTAPTVSPKKIQSANTT